MNQKSIEKWKQFQASGLLWYVNTFLHVFGYAIFIAMENGEIVDVYPDRTHFRGFHIIHQSEGFVQLSEYMSENAEILLKEASASNDQESEESNR